MRKIAVACVLVSASLATWVGCASTTSNRYVYVAIPSQNQIVAYREDPNAGVLTQLVGSPITAGQAVQGLVIHPNKQYLYATNSGSNNVSFFTIAASGALLEVTPRANTGVGPTAVAMDPAGKYLFVGNSGSFDMSVFSIDQTTSPTKGQLTQVGANVPVGISPLNMKVSPNGGFLYVTGGGQPGYVLVFSIDPSSGSLTQIPGSPYTTGQNPAGLAISTDGGFLDNTLSEFSIASDGSLTPIIGSPIGLTTSGPVALLIDNSGKFMFVASDQNPGLVLVFSVGATGTGAGALNQLSQSQIATGPQPNVLASDASGRFVFIGNQSTPQIHSFSLDVGSGILTSVAAYSVPGTPTSIVTTP
jgi:6-phosphogluconolactonase